MQTNWWPGIIALFTGLIASAIALQILGRRGNTAPEPDDEGKQLDARIRALKEQLKELNTDKHLYDAEAFTREKTRLEQDAVSAMKAKDELKTKKREPKKAPKPPQPSKHPMLTGVLYGAGVTGFIAAALFTLMAQVPRVLPAVSTSNDPRYEAMLVLSAISISFGDQEKLLQAWEIYMRQQPPRRRPPQLSRAMDWLEKVANGEDPGE